MKKLLIIFLSVYCIQLLLSCSSDFNEENWEGAVFVSAVGCNSYGNNFENDSARIELLSDSVCKVENLTFIYFSDSVRWPERFIGEWYLHEFEYSKTLFISYDHRSVGICVEPLSIECGLKIYRNALRYYVGDPDEMVYHLLVPEKEL